VYNIVLQFLCALCFCVYLREVLYLGDVLSILCMITGRGNGIAEKDLTTMTSPMCAMCQNGKLFSSFQTLAMFSSPKNPYFSNFRANIDTLYD